MLNLGLFGLCQLDVLNCAHFGVFVDTHIAKYPLIFKHSDIVHDFLCNNFDMTHFHPKFHLTA